MTPVLVWLPLTVLGLFLSSMTLLDTWKDRGAAQGRLERLVAKGAALNAAAATVVYVLYLWIGIVAVEAGGGGNWSPGVVALIMAEAALVFQCGVRRWVRYQVGHG